jgi:hypothetical protein
MHEKRGCEAWATKIESWLPTADAAKADGVSRGMEHDDVGQSVPRLLRTAMLTLLRLSVLTPSCDANSRFPRVLAPLC